MPIARPIVRRRGPGWCDRFAPALADPDALLRSDGARVLKQEPGGRAVALVTLDGTVVVVKAYDESRLKHVLQALLEGTAAARAARGIDRFAAAGLPAPQLVAVLEPATVLKQRSWLVTRAIDGVAADTDWDALPEERRVQVATALGTVLRTMHARGLYPQDARAANWLLVRNSDTPVLVDLDRVRVYRHLSWRRRMKNLAQLHRDLLRDGGPPEAAFVAAYEASTEAAAVHDARARLVERSRAMDEMVARRGAARQRRAAAR